MKNTKTKLKPGERICNRFEPVPITPRQMVEALDCDETKIKSLVIDNSAYKLSDRFYKTLAGELGIPYGVFGFFTPLEVMERAAAKVPDLQLRVTVDTEGRQALGLTQNKGLPMPINYIENVLHNDKRLTGVEYSDGVLSAMLDLDDPWDVPNDSTYGMRVRCRVPVDGVGMPDMSLATWRQVCSNGAVAETSLFRTKMEIKDNSGEHFRRLLASFSNPSGVEMLQERMCNAAETKASVGEVVLLEGLIRRSVANARNQMLLRERLNDVADNPCVRYGVTDLANIGQKKRPLLPVGCSVADLLNFASELGTHHSDLLKSDSTLQSFSGTLLSKGFDLEGLYPHTARTSSFYLNGINFSKGAA
ncbi:MAG: hypothetical protein IJ146_02725 [Kiritimatiellae bacterium]|nr:hypothetical protein [Kiritimatiellia bacterium]MBR6733968.1 hypothetical protein [Kiritimatiellia bacterium]